MNSEIGLASGSAIDKKQASFILRLLLIIRAETNIEFFHQILSMAMNFIFDNL
jgi:hypothetical protein